MAASPGTFPHGLVFLKQNFIMLCTMTNKGILILKCHCILFLNELNVSMTG